MTRKIILSTLFAIIASCAFSQEIYEEVKNLKKRVEGIMNDTSQDLEVRKVACFKNDALYYLMEKAGEDDHFTEYNLGMQANAMIEFVNLYVKRISSETKKKDRELLMAQFRDATISYSLFNDMEKEIVYGYVDNENFITQFSLDTDWVKALEEVCR